MSTNAKTPKVYAPGTSLKEFKFDNGSVIRFGINVDKFVEFIKQHKNDKGYVNLNINLRREKDQYGDTHSLSLDTYKKPADTATDKPSKSALKTLKALPVEPDGDF